MITSQIHERTRKWWAALMVLAGFYIPAVLFFYAKQALRHAPDPGGENGIDWYFGWLWADCTVCALAATWMLMGPAPQSRTMQQARAIAFGVLVLVTLSFPLMMIALIRTWSG